MRINLVQFKSAILNLTMCVFYAKRRIMKVKPYNFDKAIRKLYNWFLDVSREICILWNNFFSSNIKIFHKKRSKATLHRNIDNIHTCCFRQNCNLITVEWAIRFWNVNTNTRRIRSAKQSIDLSPHGTLQQLYFRYINVWILRPCKKIPNRAMTIQFRPRVTGM